MFISPVILNPRTFAFNTFDRLYEQGQASRLFHALTGGLFRKGQPVRHEMAVPTAGAEIRDLPLEMITAAPAVKEFDEKFRPLDLSIRNRWIACLLQAHAGEMQPVTVRRHGDGYQVVSGMLQVSVAKALGWNCVPVVVRDCPPHVNCRNSAHPSRPSIVRMYA